MKIWRMRFPCWIPKATDTHSEFVILTAFPPEQRTNVAKCSVTDTLAVLSNIVDNGKKSLRTLVILLM